MSKAKERAGTGMPTAAIAGELRKIAKAHGPAIQPEHVIQAARDPRSVLHGFFPWGIAHSAEAYRLTQAQCLLRVVGAGRQVG
jgi:hypothetical protein